MSQVFMLLTLTAIPFWVFIMVTSGFFGEYSTEIADLRTNGAGILYLQPYSVRDGHGFSTIVPALSFAGILEDKDERDLTSQMHFK